LPSNTRWLARLGRGIALLTGLATGLFAILFGPQIRETEAMILRFLVSPWANSTRVDTTVYLGLGTRRAIGLDITAECTVGVLLLPLLLAYCAFVIFRGVRIRSALTGLGQAFVIVAVANELRLVSIMVAWHRWGTTGLWVAHVLVGSIVSLAAVVVALAIQLRRSVRDGRALPRTY
jgi:exosortase/archaeosortase family protein